MLQKEHCLWTQSGIRILIITYKTSLKLSGPLDIQLWQIQWEKGKRKVIRSASFVHRKILLVLAKGCPLDPRQPPRNATSLLHQGQPSKRVCRSMWLTSNDNYTTQHINAHTEERTTNYNHPLPVGVGTALSPCLNFFPLWGAVIWPFIHSLSLSVLAYRGHVLGRQLQTRHRAPPAPLQGLHPGRGQ